MKAAQEIIIPNHVFAIKKNNIKLNFFCQVLSAIERLLFLSTFSIVKLE